MQEPLVAAIAAGDAEAFTRWMRGAERPIRESLRRYAASVDTEAVLQETLLRVWQVAPRFTHDGEPNGLLRLAVRIAHNLAISELRRHGRCSPQEAVDLERARDRAAAEAQPDPSDPGLRARLVACRQQLPAKPRQAFDARLTRAPRESDAHLAEKLGMQKNTFLQNIGRARKLLLECLERLGVTLEDLPS